MRASASAAAFLRVFIGVVGILGKQGFIIAAFNQARQFRQTFRAFHPVARLARGQIGWQHGSGFRLPGNPVAIGGVVKLRVGQKRRGCTFVDTRGDCGGIGVGCRGKSLLIGVF